MSGPALRQLASHHAIHDAAFQESNDLTSLLAHSIEHNDEERAEHIAHVLLEQWETRTLRHAAIEEEEFYQEIRDSVPHMEPMVLRLTRDHELLRTLAQDINHLLSQNSIDRMPASLIRFQAMLQISRIHSRDEEKFLIEPIEAHRA